eukprot:scaffold1499_cov255-Pinguiococcus_pyrenoidosus.AAC.18
MDTAAAYLHHIVHFALLRQRVARLQPVPRVSSKHALGIRDGLQLLLADLISMILLHVSGIPLVQAGDIILQELLQGLQSQLSARAAPSAAVVPASYGHALQLLLRDRLLHHAYFYAPDGEQPVHDHRVLLADPMGSVLRLGIHLRIPVRVEEDHDAGSSEVDAEAAGAGGQEERELVGTLAHKVVDVVLTVLQLAGAIDAAVAPPLVRQVVLKNVHHACELAEDEHLLARSVHVGPVVEPPQDPVQQAKLAGRVDQ